MNGESYEKCISYLARPPSEKKQKISRAQEARTKKFEHFGRRDFVKCSRGFSDVSKYFQETFLSLFHMSGETFEKLILFLRVQSEQK